MRLKERTMKMKETYYEFDKKAYLKCYAYMYVLLWLLPPTILCTISYLEGLLKGAFILFYYIVFLFVAIICFAMKTRIWKGSGICINDNEIIYTRVKRDGYNNIYAHNIPIRLSYEKQVDIYHIRNIQAYQKTNKALLIEGDICLNSEKQFNSNIREKERYLSRVRIPFCFKNEEMLIDQIYLFVHDNKKAIQK